MEFAPRPELPPPYVPRGKYAPTISKVTSEVFADAAHPDIVKDEVFKKIEDDIKTLQDRSLQVREAFEDISVLLSSAFKEKLCQNDDYHKEWEALRKVPFFIQRNCPI
jgi:hypothetical protein